VSWARQYPVHPASPHVRLHLAVIDVDLLGEGARFEQPLHSAAQSRPHPEVGAKAARHQAGKAIVIKAVARPLALEPAGVAVPEFTGEFRQVTAQRLAVDARESGVASGAEGGEEVLEFKASNGGQLQFQQRRLARIGVHGVDARRPAQRIVEHVAAGAGDDQHAVAFPYA